MLKGGRLYMFCRYCGKSIAEDSDFCTYCGRLINNNPNDMTPSAKEKLCNKKLSDSNSFFAEHLPLIVRTLCYIALGTFLFFNIKMAPFYGWWKFLAYVVEAAIAIYLTILTKDRISESNSFNLKLLSVIFSVLIILSSVTLRIVYESKVDIVEKDIPRSGTILVDISRDTDYYSYTSGLVSDPSTSISINGASDPAKVTLGQPTKLDIKVKGNHKSGTTSDTITLYASDFADGTYSITKRVYLDGGISATVKVTLRRYCTFWEVIFY